MCDVSKTNEQITEAAGRLRKYYEAGEVIHMASSYRTGDGVTHIIDFEDLRTVVEAATRVPVQGEPNGEPIEYALDYIENGTMRPARREALRALALRATVPDAATERYRDAAEGNRIRLVHAQNDAEQAEAERDAALAAIERAKALVAEWQNTGAASGPFPDRTVLDVDAEVIAPLHAALDGAPEPEWEYRARLEHKDLPGIHHFSKKRPFTEEEMSNPGQFGECGTYWAEDGRLVNQERRRPAGPWLPVEGEKP